MNYEETSPKFASKLNRILAKTKGLRHIGARRREVEQNLCCDGRKANHFSDVRDAYLFSEAKTSGSESSSSDTASDAWCHESDAVSRNGTVPKSRLTYFSARDNESILRKEKVSSAARDSQILENLFELLQMPDPIVREKALTTIFHLVQSSPAMRDAILEAGGVQPILAEIQRRGPADAQIARALFHLCMGRPLHRLLLASEQEEVLVIVAFVLNVLTVAEDTQNANYIARLVPPPLHGTLVTLLSHESMDVRFRALQLIGKITAADRLHGPMGESQSFFKESTVVQHQAASVLIY